jgi:hypothetical protein
VFLTLRSLYELELFTHKEDEVAPTLLAVPKDKKIPSGYSVSINQELRFGQQYASGM